MRHLIHKCDISYINANLSYINVYAGQCVIKLYMHIHSGICIPVYMYVYIYIYIYIYICAPQHTHTCVCAHIHTHTHSLSPSLSLSHTHHSLSPSHTHSHARIQGWTTILVGKIVSVVACSQKFWDFFSEILEKNPTKHPTYVS